MKKDPIELAKDLIRFPTITPIDEGIIDFLCDYLTPYGFECKKLVFGEVTNLYARYGREEPNFCFAGHTDVVPPGENWSSNPFDPTIKDGMLYGRGASDMKAALAAFVIASIEFVENNKFNGSISFLITGDEEAIAKDGTIKVLEYLKDNNETLSSCIVGEPTCSKSFGDIIKYGRRGSISFNLTVDGKQGHVAYPELSDNPIDRLLRILTDLKEKPLDAGNEDFDPSNLEITDITVGNPISNIIPSQAQAKFNIRFNNLHNPEALEKLIKQICLKHSTNFVLQSNCGSKPFVNSKDSKVIECLKESIVQVIGKTPVLSTTGGTSDARFIKDACPVVEFGLLNKTAHHVDEHISCKDISDLKEIYLSFLKKYFQ